MRSVASVTIGVGLISVLLTGCSSSSSNTSGNTSEASGEGKTVTLRIIASDGPFAKGGWGYNEIQAFMKAYPNIKVQVTYTNGQAFKSAVVTAASSNDLPDIIESNWAFSLPEMLQNNWVQPLNPLLPKSWVSKWPSGTFVNGVNASNGNVYSFPLNDPLAGPVLVYNKTVMKEAGLNPDEPPKTWSQLLQMSQQVTKAGNGKYYGFVLPMQDSEGGQYFCETLADTVNPTLANGYDAKTGEYAYNSPAMIKAIELLLQMKKSGVIDPNSLSYKITDAQGAFFNKKAAFMIDYNWIVSVAHQQAPNLDYGIAPLPTPKAGQSVHIPKQPGGSEFFISKTTQHAKQAAELIQWFSSKSVMTSNMKDNLQLPGLTSVMNDPSNFPLPQLKQMADIYKQEVVQSPVKDTPGEIAVQKIESTLPTPEPDWWQVIQGAYVGKLSDWQQQLNKVNQAYNARRAQAIKQAQSQGEKVTGTDFTSPNWDGTTNYSNN